MLRELEERLEQAYQIFTKVRDPHGFVCLDAYFQTVDLPPNIESFDWLFQQIEHFKIFNGFFARLLNRLMSSCLDSFHHFPDDILRHLYELYFQDPDVFVELPRHILHVLNQRKPNSITNYLLDLQARFQGSQSKEVAYFLRGVMPSFLSESDIFYPIFNPIFSQLLQQPIDECVNYWPCIPDIIYFLTQVLPCHSRNFVSVFPFVLTLLQTTKRNFEDENFEQLFCGVISTFASGLHFLMMHMKSGANLLYKLYDFIFPLMHFFHQSTNYYAALFTVFEATLHLDSFRLSPKDTTFRSCLIYYIMKSALNNFDENTSSNEIYRFLFGLSSYLDLRHSTRNLLKYLKENNRRLLSLIQEDFLTLIQGDLTDIEQEAVFFLASFILDNNHLEEFVDQITYEEGENFILQASKMALFSMSCERINYLSDKDIVEHYLLLCYTAISEPQNGNWNFVCPLIDPNDQIADQWRFAFRIFCNLYSIVSKNRVYDWVDYSFILKYADFAGTTAYSCAVYTMNQRKKIDQSLIPKILDHAKQLFEECMMETENNKQYESTTDREEIRFTAPFLCLVNLCPVLAANPSYPIDQLLAEMSASNYFDFSAAIGIAAQSGFIFLETDYFQVSVLTPLFEAKHPFACRFFCEIIQKTFLNEGFMIFPSFFENMWQWLCYIVEYFGKEVPDYINYHEIWKILVVDNFPEDLYGNLRFLMRLGKAMFLQGIDAFDISFVRSALRNCTEKYCEERAENIKEIHQNKIMLIALSLVLTKTDQSPINGQDLKLFLSIIQEMHQSLSSDTRELFFHAVDASLRWYPKTDKNKYLSYLEKEELI